MKTHINISRRRARQGIILALAIAGFGSLAMLAQPRPGDNRQQDNNRPPPQQQSKPPPQQQAKPPPQQAPRPAPAPAPAPRPSLPKNYTPVSYNNNNYYTHRGVFYQNTPKGYTVVRPPVGIRIASLPLGFARVILNGLLYYRYNDIYYQSVTGGGYVVVNTPPGVVVSTPPVVVQQQPNVVIAPAPVTVNSSYQTVMVAGSNTAYMFRDGQFFQQASDGSLVWTPAPVGAIITSLPTDATSVWYQNIEFLDCDGVYFQKTPYGYQVVNPPWPTNTIPGQ